MIPTNTLVTQLWDKYKVPENKRIHMSFVADVAKFLADRLLENHNTFVIHTSLIFAAALLHDIDKNVEKYPGESHPDAGVRILMLEGMPEVAQLIKYHPVHCIVNPQTSPHTWEEKLLFLSDKMVKYEIITVDKRFALWRSEHMDVDTQAMFDRCYPLVKLLEAEIFSLVSFKPEDVHTLLTDTSELSTKSKH